MAFARVQAVQRGQYGGVFRDKGDVFDITNASDLSDSTVSQVPVGNPDYPLFGWMLVVPNATPLYSYALSNGGNSSVVQGTYSANSQGVTNLSIPRYVV
jgi:hypothetical protein